MTEARPASFNREFWEELRKHRGEKAITADIGPFHNVLIDLLREMQHPKVVDVGCGDGSLAHRLMEIPNLTYIGVDETSAGIRLAAGKHPAERVQFIRGNGSCLPVSSESVDVVVMLGALHHGGWPMLGEARRVLRGGGILAIIDHSVEDSLAARATYKLADAVPIGLRARPPLNHFFLGGSVPETIKYSKDQLEYSLKTEGFGTMRWYCFTSGMLFGLEALLLLVEGLIPTTTEAMKIFRARANQIDLMHVIHSRTRRTVNFMLIARAPSTRI